MKKKAFTLIELIVVLAIISLLMSVVAIRFDIVSLVKEKNEINTILGDINYCKEKSRVTGIEYGFSIDDSKTYSLVRLKVNHDDPEDKKIVKMVKLEQVEIISISLSNGGSVTSFKASGSVANPGTVTIRGLESVYKLSIGVAGANIRVGKK